MAHFFINRPIFAWVIAIVIMLGGGLALKTLPIEQYPDIAPPQVSIGATYTGASAETVESSVSQVIEQQLKGIDNLLYMESTSDASGSSRTTLTFSPGTNVDLAQMQVQNKLQQAMSRLPPAVQSRGVTVTKGGNDYMIVYHFASSDPEVSAVDVGDFVATNLVDVIGRVDGVGEVQLFGTNYAMRIWMDPHKLEKYALMPSDIANAIQAQNTQVSAGKLGNLPALPNQQLNATITARSKLQTVAQFENVVLKATPDGAVVLLKDVARVELGSDNPNSASMRNGMAGAGMGIVLADGANAMAVADAVHAKVAELAPFLPDGLTPYVTRDSSPFVRASIREVVVTLLEAMALVVVVMFVFLQNFRATLIPAIAVPVVLLGTFGVLSMVGYSINMLTMFAMVLAIGLLVDDAIVVVENVERVMREEGLAPKAAARKSMHEITPALVGIGVTLSAVFIPMAFFGGSTGVIYRQFSVTIVAAMALSVFVALTLTPALCATLLKPVVKGEHAGHGGVPRQGVLGVNDRFFSWFNHHFDRTSRSYQRGVAGWLGRSKRVALIYLLLCGIAAVLFMRLPTSFLPNEDQGVMSIQVNLPAGASDARVRVVLKEVTEYMAQQPDVISFNSVLGRGGDQSSARGFIRLKDWRDRPAPSQHAEVLARKATRDLARLRDARIIVSLPPAVRGLGSTAGFNFQLKDLNGLGHEALMAAKDTLLAKARERDDVMINVRSTNLDDSAQLSVVIDDRKAAALGLATADVNAVLSSALGGAYLNDFLHNGRVKRVYVQGDAPFRMLPQDIGDWTVRNKNGEMVPFSAFSESTWTGGPPEVRRYNGSPSFEFVGSTPAGVSTGDAMAAIDGLMKDMPAGIGHEWTGASLQERLSGEQAPMLYAISILFVFLCLAALYESWTVPMSVILSVPLGVIGALVFTGAREFANDVYFQVGLLTTVGLASKNAILIVEFATQLQDEGRSVFDATLEAVRLRLRPIIMTSLAFGFGVFPLAIGTGAGAAGRQAIGTAVLGGMVFSTVLGLFFVPVFFLLVRSWFKSKRAPDEPQV